MLLVRNILGRSSVHLIVIIMFWRVIPHRSKFRWKNIYVYFIQTTYGNNRRKLSVINILFWRDFTALWPYFHQCSSASALTHTSVPCSTSFLSPFCAPVIILRRTGHLQLSSAPDPFPCTTPSNKQIFTPNVAKVSQIIHRKKNPE